MNALITKTPFGRRAIKATDDEIQRMLRDGTAVHVKKRIYRQVDAPVAKVEEPDEASTTYETKVMTAEKPAPRRRGRPRRKPVEATNE